MIIVEKLDFNAVAVCNNVAEVTVKLLRVTLSHLHIEKSTVGKSAFKDQLLLEHAGFNQAAKQCRMYCGEIQDFQESLVMGVMTERRMIKLRKTISRNTKCRTPHRQ